MKNFSKGLEGVVATETAISKIDGRKGRLIYRGYKIEELAENSTYEEVAFLLLNEKLPDKKELSNFRSLLAKNMSIPSPIKDLIRKTPKRTPAIASLRTCISFLSSFDKNPENLSFKENRKRALRILGVMPSLIVAIQRTREGKNIILPKKGLSFAGNFLYMLKGKVPDKSTERTLDVALILHAEHGLNASTFSARVTVATLSDIYSGIVSALGTLKGPLHGGANRKAIQSLHFLGDELDIKEACEGSCLEHVNKYVLRLLKERKRIMGIGHRVYKVKDPRAKIFEKYASRVSNKNIKYYQMAKEIEKVMAEEKNLYPNIDFFSGIVYEDIGIKPELYVCIFALGRVSGWLAHILEQYSNNRLIRPTSIYTGDTSKKYLLMQRRK